MTCFCCILKHGGMVITDSTVAWYLGCEVELKLMLTDDILKIMTSELNDL